MQQQKGRPKPSNSPRPRCACYIRVSTSAQVERFSLPAQRRILTDFCKHEGWEPIFYEDRGISGETLDKRPAILRLLHDAREKKFQVAIAVEAERFSRSTDLIDWLVIKRTFRDAGIRWGTQSQMYEPGDVEDEFTSDLLGILSKREKLKIVERTKRGKVEAARQGHFIATTAPFGYRKSPQSSSRLAVDPPEARVVQQVFSLLVNRRSSVRKITQTLTDRGVPTRTGAAWSRSMVWKILTTATYTGTATFNRQKRTFDGKKELRRLRPRSEWIAVPVPAIISKETFEMARRQLQDNTGVLNPRAAKRMYLLTGLVRCGRCGRKMYGHFRDRRYYRCEAERGPDFPTRCKMGGVPAELLEDAVWLDLASTLQTPSSLAAHVEGKQGEGISAHQETVKRLQDVEQALSRLSQERARAQTMYLEGVSSVDEAKSHVERLRRKHESLEKERQELEAIIQAQVVGEEKAQTLDAFVSAARRKLWRSTPQEKFNLIHAFIERVEISPDGKRATVQGIMPIKYISGVRRQPYTQTFNVQPRDLGKGLEALTYHVAPMRTPRSNSSVPSQRRSTRGGADQTDRGR